MLWVDRHGIVQEAGMMNFFILWQNETELELVTPPLDGTILPGVTRDSVLQLAREWGYCKVNERTFNINEIIKAIEHNRVKECFCCGTAAVISSVKTLGHNDKNYSIPTPQDGLTHALLKKLVDIQYGKQKHPWSHVIDC